MQTQHAQAAAGPATQPRVDSAAPCASPVPPLGIGRLYGKEATIHSAGDDAVFFYQVRSGIVRSSMLLSDGRRQVHAFHMPGDFFAIEPGAAHTLSAEAVTDVTVAAYRRSTYDLTGDMDPQFFRRIVASMMSSLERTQRHTLLLGRKSAIERIAAFLLDAEERASAGNIIALPMSRSDIADHLGLTIETVSRCLTQLERDGAISVPGHRRTIAIRDRGQLERLDA